jgi:hypothetical protein
MGRHAIALTFFVLGVVALPARGDSVGMTDGGSPDFAAIERLLDEQSADSRRRLM